MSKWWTAHRGSVAWLLLLLLGAGGIFWVQSIAGSTHDALCTLRVNIEQRVATSQEFLAKHPHGVPGISRSVIVAGIQRDQTAVDALSNLNC